MIAAECVEQLKRKKSERPFKPFEIEVENGSRYHVPHRWAFAASAKTILVIDPSDFSQFIPMSKVTATTTL